MELNVTEFVMRADPFTYSHSRAEKPFGDGGWQSAKDADLAILHTEEELGAFASFVLSSGGWTDAEVMAMREAGELNALAVQWLSGDMREPVGFEIGPDTTDDQWEEYERQSEMGNVSGRLFRGIDGNIYWNIGE